MAPKRVLTGRVLRVRDEPLAQGTKDTVRYWSVQAGKQEVGYHVSSAYALSELQGWHGAMEGRTIFDSLQPGFPSPITPVYIKA